MVKRIFTVIMVLTALCSSPGGALWSALGLGGAEALAAGDDFETGTLASTWNTGVVAPWVVTQPGHLSANAAQAPALADLQSSFIETTLDVLSTGDVSFWYRVSSEGIPDVMFFDGLVFYIDGIQVSGLWSGEIDWTQFTTTVSAGSHVFRWEYVKDASGSVGGDTAWIDDIVFPGVPVVPTYTITASVPGGNGTISCVPLVVDLGKNSDCTITPANGFRLATLLDNGADVWFPNLNGSYTVSNVTADHTIVATFSAAEANDIETFETNNLRKFPWFTGGDVDAKWFVTQSGHVSTYAAQAPVVGNSQSSFLETTLNIPQPGNVTFWLSVSSEEGGDFLRFYIDNVEQGSLEQGFGWSGTVPWTQVSFPVTAGVHTFRWVYKKDIDTFAGSDTAWIDDIVFPGAVFKQTYSIAYPGAILNGSISCTPATVAHGFDSTCTITADPGYHLATFFDNAVDKLSFASGNSYTISKVAVDHTISGSFAINEASDIETFETGDFAKFPWAPDVNLPWSVTQPGHASTYAAQPPSLSDSQTSSLETTLNIPADGNMSFWYKVSSEGTAGVEFFDGLVFYLDGLKVSGLWSGEIDWTQFTIPVAAGVHTFRWEFTKDSSDGPNVGQNTAWIDDIVFPGVTYKPSYTINASVVGGNGAVACVPAPVDYNAPSVCTISPDPGYHFASLIDNTVDRSLLVSNGSYSLSNVINDHTIVVTFASNENIEDFETGTWTKFFLTTGGSGNWSITQTTAHSGTFAAESPVLADNGVSFLETTLYVPTLSTMSFWYSVSSELGADYLRFYIDGVEQGTGWSGKVVWTQASYEIGEGNHTFRWEYVKDGIASAGSDAAWIDDIIIPGATLPRPVKLVRAGAVDIYKLTLQEAYDIAITDDIIMLTENSSIGGLMANNDAIVTVKGGYDSAFKSNTGVTITGPTTLKAGKVLVDGIKVK